MILAIYGQSKVGKTSAAAALSAASGFPVRSCGDELKRILAKEGISGEVPERIHRDIDQQTVRWVTSSPERVCLVEGRFLNYVLSSLSQPVYLVRLVAAPAVRLTRLRDVNIGIDGLLALDQQDESFCNAFYDGHLPLTPVATVDTSDLTVQSCVDRFTNLIQEQLRPS